MTIQIKQIDASDDQFYDQHKVIYRFDAPSEHLRGYVAIHNNNRGPAIGGTRMYPYKNKVEAIQDALKLSRAMTYKCAIAELPFGGGKAVIMGDPQKHKTKAMILAYGKIIDSLKGAFITGEDVGITESDVQQMLTVSNYFVGRKGLAGDPSYYAALSVYHVMQTMVNLLYEDQDFSKKIIAIKGIGKLGSVLLQLLSESKAKIIVADINPAAIAKARSNHPNIEVVSSEEIHKIPSDIFAPCALGNDINPKTIKEIKTNLICGGANNQLSTSDIAIKLHKRNIYYVPDFLANAGGLIDVADELEPGGYNKKRVLERIRHLQKIATDIYTISKKKKVAPLTIANAQAEKFFQTVTKK